MDPTGCVECSHQQDLFSCPKCKRDYDDVYDKWEKTIKKEVHFPDEEPAIITTSAGRIKLVDHLRHKIITMSCDYVERIAAHKRKEAIKFGKVKEWKQQCEEFQHHEVWFTNELKKYEIWLRQHIITNTNKQNSPEYDFDEDDELLLENSSDDAPAIEVTTGYYDDDDLSLWTD